MSAPPLPGITPSEFIAIAYDFMRGLPTAFGGGYAMLSPSELRKQRFCYIAAWHKRLVSDYNAIVESAKVS